VFILYCGVFLLLVIVCFCYGILDLVSSVLATRLARKNVSKVTYFVSSGMQNLNLVLDTHVTVTYFCCSCTDWHIALLQVNTTTLACASQLHWLPCGSVPMLLTTRRCSSWINTHQMANWSFVAPKPRTAWLVCSVLILRCVLLVMAISLSYGHKLSTS